MAINNFKKLRLSKGLTVDELAVASEVHKQTINAIESEPQVDTMRRLAKGLEVDYEDVYQAIFGVNTPVEV